MRKLKLEIDALAVESFDTHAAAQSRGTVRGLESYIPLPASVDPGLDTCAYATCASDSCAGYTYCIKNLSCIDQCLPTDGQPGCNG